MKDVETGEGGVIRRPNLDVILRVTGQEHILGTLSSELTTKRDPSGDPANDPTASYVIPQDLRGQAGELIFRLSIPATQSTHQFGEARVWLDNVTILSAQPIAAETQGETDAETAIVSQGPVDTLAQAAQRWWTGLVQSPDRIVGLSLGSIGSATANFLGHSTGSNGGNNNNLWNAGLGEGGFNNQLSLVDADIIVSQGTCSFGIDLTGLGTNQKGILNGNPSVSSYGHSINTSGYTDLILCQHATLTSLADSVVDGGIANESNVIVNGIFVDQGAIEVSDFDGCLVPSAPGSERTVPNSQVHDFKGFAVETFPGFTTLSPQFSDFEGIDPFLHFKEQ